MTIIELSDDLAQRLQAAAEAQGQTINNYAVAKLEQVLATEDPEADEELIAALREGMDQANAGQLRTQEQVDATVYAAIAAHIVPGAAMKSAA